MTTYKYETHLHTKEGSACGTSGGAEYIKAFYDAGYAGIFVTDHFFGGNTAAPKIGKWEDRVNIYCSGYEAALKQAESFNKENGLVGTDKEFKVFFGIEQTFNGDDYLLYGLDKKWLYAHPEIETLNHSQLFEAVNRAEGLMIQAHPFRLRGYINAICLHPRDVHGVEIYNAGNQPQENEIAELYAKQYNFSVTSGSDIHNISFIKQEPGRLPLGGMEFNSPLTDVFDYVERIKFNRGKIIKNF